MKPSTLNFTALVAALFATSGSFAPADEATTDPVGFLTKTLAASGGSTRVSSTVSFPLYRPPVYTAAATSVTNGSPSSTCQVNGFNAGTTDVVTNPHLLRVKAATDTTHVGRFFLITAASGDQLTVSEASLSSFLSIGDTCEILPANTVGNIFGTITGTTSTVPAGWQTGATAAVSDNVFIFDGAVWKTYFHNGTSWRRTDSILNQNKAVVYPDEGVFASRIGTSPVSLVATGTVPTTTERSDVAGTASTFLSNRFPTDMQLVDLGIHLIPGWDTGATAAEADKVFVHNGTVWETFFHNGTSWRKTTSILNQNTTVISAGSGVFITRSAGSTATLTQTLPYTP